MLWVVVIGALAVVSRVLVPAWFDIEYFPVVAAAALGAWAGSTMRLGREANAWRWISSAWGFSALGLVLFFVARWLSSPAVEGAADTLWNAYYVLSVIGLLSMVPLPATPTLAWQRGFEASTVAIACGLWVYYFIGQHAGADAFTLWTNAAGETAVLVSACLVLSADRVDASKILLGGACLLATLADLSDASVRFALADPFASDVALIASATMVALAGLVRPGAQRRSPGPLGVALRALAHLPTLVSLGVVGVLVAEVYADRPSPYVIQVLAVGAAVVVGLQLVGLAMAQVALESQADERAQQTERLAAVHRFVAMGQVASVAVHDLNNLVLVLHSVADDLRVAGAAPDTIADLDAVAERAGRICKDMLKLGKTRPPGRVDVGAAVRGLEALLRRLVPRQIDVSFEIDTDLFAIADGARLELVIVNLVSNARDATAVGWIAIRAGVRIVLAGDPLASEGVPPGRWVALEVADSGEGMSPDVRARATTSFFTTKGARGTGLGLAQAAEFARAVDGRLVIHSTPDVGTTVTVLLRPS